MSATLINTKEVNMELFIQKPDTTQYEGIRVTKDTDIKYSNEYVEQTIKNLELHSITRLKGEGYESSYDTRVTLADGDVLIFEDEKRGYIKPLEPFMSVAEAIDELKSMEG